MKKGKISIIIGGIIAAIIIGVFVVQFSEDSDLPKIVDVDKDGIPDDVDPYIPEPRVWQTSGPFQIDRTQYRLGEQVLIRIGNLAPDEIGQIVFLRQLNDTHSAKYITIPFNGTQKNSFNQYFKPDLSRQLGICTTADLIVNWKVEFQGTNYNNLEFEIIDEFIPGDEEHYGPVC